TVCSLNLTATRGAKKVPESPTICISITTNPARPKLSPLSTSRSGSQVIKVKKINDCKPINKLTCQANFDRQTLTPLGSAILFTVTLSFRTCGIQTICVRITTTILAIKDPLQPWTSAKGMLTPVPMAANNDNPVV